MLTKRRNNICQIAMMMTMMSQRSSRSTNHPNVRKHFRWMMILLLPCIVFLPRICDGIDNNHHGTYHLWNETLRSVSVSSDNDDTDNNHWQQHGRRLGDQQKSRKSGIRPSGEPIRILYTVTTLNEYDEGTRATTKGFDRLSYLLIPVVKEGVSSLHAAGYHVDVCIVSHYEMTRPKLLYDALADVEFDVHVQYWDNAAPLSYKPDKRDDPKAALWRNTLALARQHRFVVKDHLFNYDVFLNFEDDMIIHAGMVDNYLAMTEKLYKLRETSPDSVPDQQLKSFYGPLTKDQLKRSYPGLMRVEVLLDEEQYGTQEKLDPVPVATHPDIDPRPCCHLQYAANEGKRPPDPTTDKMFLWETNIVALGVRHVEGLGWLALLRGPRARAEEKGMTWSDYWSGTQGYFPKDVKRPAPGSFNYINNEGGWIGTRQQIWEWHTEVCPGGFLPPFDSPHYNFDGLDPRNVEYWSGGLNLFTVRHACNMQRLISLDPDDFARHLIYHSANNKQRQLSYRKKTFTKINDLYGQLLTVAKDAEGKRQTLEQKNS
jgi:hypothetical protein